MNAYQVDSFQFMRCKAVTVHNKEVHSIALSRSLVCLQSVARRHICIYVCMYVCIYVTRPTGSVGRGAQGQ